MSLSTGLLLAAPALALCLWYSLQVVAIHLRYNRALGVEQPLTAELFHLRLHDLLARDWRRLTMPDLAPEKQSPLATYGLHLGNLELDKLDRRLPPKEGKQGYEKAWLEVGQGVFNGKARYRGTKHWHWAGPKKSWKVKLKRDEMLEGRQTFNFVNPSDPLPFGEEIVFDIARGRGLMAPDYFPVRVMLNNAYMGLYYYRAQPDESLARESRRIPGSLYSGNRASISDQTGLSSLWEEVANWRKVAAHTQPELTDTSELERLLRAVNADDRAAFAEFARDHLDVERFAVMDALDIVFGTNQHDFNQGHKLYFDPYRGRFEPIAWNFGEWKHRLALNRTENPLLLKLKELPEYVTMRSRIVLELLGDEASPAAVRSRLAALMERVRKDRETDPYWDAIDLTPAISRYWRQMIRPMDADKQQVVFASRMEMFEERARYLAQSILARGLSGRVIPAGASAGDTLGPATVVEVVVAGESGYRVTALAPEWPAGCRASQWRVAADRDLDGRYEPVTDDVVAKGDRDGTIGLKLDLFPGVRLVERIPPHPYRGKVRSVSQPREYRLFLLGADCQAAAVRLKAVHLAGGVTESWRLTAEDLAGQGEPQGGKCALDVALAGSPGEASPHPWCYPQGKASPVTLGPGVVAIPETRIYRGGQAVSIAAGTVFRMGPGASLVFEGKVEALGEAAKPILFTGEDGAGWGSVALQGQASSGSRLRHVRLEGGGASVVAMKRYPAVLNVHDTAEVRVEHLTMAGQGGEGDADSFHAAYVKGLVLADAEFRHVPADAVDLELVSGRIERLRVLGAGDDGLDLMGADVAVTAAAILDASGFLISAGEETRLRISDSILAGGKTGFLVKSAATVDADRLLLADLESGVKIGARSRYYTNDNRFDGGTVAVLRCEELKARKKRAGVEIERLLEELPEGELETLRRGVLGLDSWAELGAWLARTRSGGGP
jgi:hypothetical protein